MNYTEAKELSLKVKWRTEPCTQGEECWCRQIIPDQEIVAEGGEEIYIVGSGSIAKEYAEHIVKLHNESLNK
jgi:hypothetical protein